MPERILIVSDVAARVGAARRALTAAGHVVQVATDVDHGLSVCRTFAPRILLLDATLLARRSDAVTVVPRFRAESREKIAVVALGQDADFGVDAFVAPSSDGATLVATIAAVIGEPSLGSPTRAATILVLEAERATRAHFRGVLEAHGWRVREASSVEEAAAHVREELPDLIVQDLVFPGTLGHELTELVRGQPGGESVPIVGISSRLPTDEGLAPFAVAFDAFLAKPVDPERLVNTVAKLLPATTSASQPAERTHVMVVDDDPVRLRLANVYLDNAGFRVTACHDAAAALERALEDLPRVIVTDVLMPGMDGFDLALAVRENLVLRDIPVILMSAYFQDQRDLDLMRRVGAEAMVPRTAEFREVIESVRAALGRPVPVRPPVAAAPSKQEREKRLIGRLERQLTLNAGLAQRCASQGAQLSILGGVADALAASVEVKAVFHDVLARCLETSGFSRGALFAVGPGSELVLNDSVGFGPNTTSALESAFGHGELLERVMGEQQALVVTSASPEGEEGLLDKAGAASCVVVPLVGAGRRLGVLLLLSNVADAAREDLLGFGKSIGAHIGQAMALAAAFSSLNEAERKNELLSVLAHELRGPLAPIITAAAVLRRQPDDPLAVARASTTIERQARHLARMTDDLLDASRLAHGKVNLVRQRLDLVLLARDVTEDHRDAHDAAGISLSIGGSEEALHVVGDRVRLTQVFGNLLANSVKFTPRGGSVRVEVRAHGGHEVVLSVRDTGVGIAPDMVHRVFEPFAQADHSLARSAGGLGLGLAVVKGLVELHGGLITVTSGGLDLGSEFAVVLPLDAVVVPAPVAPTSAPDPLPPPTCRVLVIDDNMDTALSLIDFLDTMGYATAVAHTGRDGVEKAGPFAPDVILCDIGLPGMDGYAVAAELRARAATSSTKLVAITGYGTKRDIQRALTAGFDRHITKPITPDALLEILAELVKPREATVPGSP